MVSNSSILKTLIYSDIFDYPLTKEEIWKFLIGKNISRIAFENALTEFPSSRWERKNGYYFLSGREEIPRKRIKRQRESEKKIQIAQRMIRKLSLIPTVLFIGISGNLALKNAEEKDDIDLFVITSKRSLWITRLLLVFLLILMGQYRGRGKKASQKVCLNMLIDEEVLMFEKDRQNLYTAHEIVQMLPVFDRNNTYQKFINANKWVKEFLPNSRIKNQELRIKRKVEPLLIVNYSLFIIEKLAMLIQLIYMHRHRANETINDNMLAFHPFEYRDYVLGEYRNRLKRYSLI